MLRVRSNEKWQGPLLDFLRCLCSKKGCAQIDCFTEPAAVVLNVHVHMMKVNVVQVVPVGKAMQKAERVHHRILVAAVKPRMAHRMVALPVPLLVGIGWLASALSRSASLVTLQIVLISRKEVVVGVALVASHI